MKLLNIAMAFNSGIFPGSRVTILSILLAHKNNIIKFFILDGGLSGGERAEIDEIVSRNGKAEVNWIQFDKSKVSAFVSHKEFTHMAYARVLLPDLLDVPSCVYVDADFLILTDLSELTQSDPLRLIAAALDGDGSTEKEYPWYDGVSDSPFVNTGLMWMNLEGWRNEGISKKILDFLAIESARCRWADQNAINWILRDRVAIVDGRFNTMANQIDAGDKKFIPGRSNIHYASGLKPWKRPLPTVSHKIWRHFATEHFGKSSGQPWTYSSILRFFTCMFNEKSLVYPFRREAREIFKEYLLYTKR